MQLYKIIKDNKISEDNQLWCLNSYEMGNTYEGMLKEINVSVTIVNCKSLQATKLSKFQGTMHQTMAIL